jgi:hypothetical membrane protein
VIVFALQDSGAVSTPQSTLSPAGVIVLGLLLLLIAYVGPKEAPRWRKALDEGSARTAFVVGILLTLPGASYLAGLDRISKARVVA